MKLKPPFASLFLLVALPLGAISAESTKSAPAGPAAPESMPAPAPAATKDQPVPLFKELDTNHDSSVNKDEARRSAEVTARYQELDFDRDGKISVAEFKKGMQPTYQAPATGA